MPFYGADFFTDTEHLSNAEGHAYLRLLWHSWITNRALPDDDRALANIAKASPQWWVRHRQTLLSFFTLGEDGWHQKRLDRERARLNQKGGDRVLQKGGDKPQKNRGNTTRAPARATPHSQSERTSQSALDLSVDRSTAAFDGAGAPRADAPGAAVCISAREELRTEGTAILTQAGVPESTARSVIGRWLRQTGDDADLVLGAIRRAREHQAVDPIAWITAAIRSATPPAGKRHAETIDEIADRLIAGGIEFGPRPTLDLGNASHAANVESLATWRRARH